MTSDMVDLASEIDDLRERFPMLKDDELFVLWFITAQITDDPEAAAAALVGGPGDKSVDAVYVDHEADRVVIVQGKYSTLGKRSERRSDVLTFATLASAISDDSEFETWLQDAAPPTREKMKSARHSLVKKGYALNLYYVTTRSCSPGLRSEATKIARSKHSQLAILQKSNVLALLDDYRDGVTPWLPDVELAIETAPASGEIRRFDAETGITAWIFSSRASDVADLYIKYGPKLFARNIRGSLGQGDEQSVNSAIRRSLKKDPSHFWYFNNGITIACDGAKQVDTGGKFVLEMQNPQIVNGLQTTVTLADAKIPTQASVLVRVVALPKTQLELIDEIVKATNRQNPIKPSDLMSNDRTQVFLARKLLLRGYHYLRKRGKKSEARAVAGGKAKFVLTKEELAQAVAACDLAPEVVRSAREALFDELNYPRVFPRRAVNYYLARYWVVKLVGRHAWGEGPERRYMKYFVAHAVWDRVGGTISGAAPVFIRACELQRVEEAPLKELERLMEATFRSVERFFSQTRKEDGNTLEVYAFFKRRGKYDEYIRFIRRTEQAALRKRLAKAGSNFIGALMA